MLPEELCDDFRVECGSAGCDPAHGLDELVDVHDPVLEQVADAAASVGEELVGVCVLDVLGDDEDRRGGSAPAYLQRGAQALVAEARRQAHVDDRDVRLLFEDAIHERVSVADRRDDVEAVVAQQPRQAVAEQREVFGDHDAQGSTASTIVGPPAGLSTRSVPSSASTRCRRPWRPEPSGSAPPRPSSITVTTSAPPIRTTRRSTCDAPACFAAFASASAATKYAASSAVSAGRSARATR